MTETEVSATPAGDPVESEDNENKMVKDVNEKGELVLTQSEKDLGIRITKPNQKIVETVTRLRAVPSEKLRVWTSWLTKVGERAADDWQWWLRAQIGLALRISERLGRDSVVASEVEEVETSIGRDDEVATKEETEVNVEVDAVEERETSPEREIIASEKTSGKLLSEDELAEEQPPVVEIADEERSREKGDKNPGNKGKKTKDGRERDKLEPKIMYEEGFWPVGVRWKPFSERGKRKPPPERQPDVIPIPRTEEEMIDLIRGIRHQGVIYRSLYKHWTETADQAVKEMFGRTVLPTKQACLRGEEIPYSFFLGSEPDLEYAVEHDDEEILLADPARERITRDFEHLYFNLSDKPGRGGKPWL